MSYSVSGIKTESIQAVMNTLARESHITRSELASRCQLSLTTIGKIVNGLHEYGVLSITSPRTSEKGRSASTVGFSDAATLAMFRIGADEMILDLIDFRLRPLHRVLHRVTPDLDPWECMMVFLTECRRKLEQAHLQIRLCGIIAENKNIDPSVAEQAISLQLGLTVTFRDSVSDAMARAATEQGIADRGNCVALLTDSGDGIILYHGEICKGALSPSPLTGHAHTNHVDRITNTFLTLTAILSPDVLLVCTEHSLRILRERLEASLGAITLPRPIAIEVRNIHDFVACGTGIAMRHAWLDEVMKDIYRLRPPSSDTHSLTPV